MTDQDKPPKPPQVDLERLAVEPLSEARLSASEFDCGPAVHEKRRSEFLYGEALGSAAKTYLMIFDGSMVVGFVTLIVESIELQQRERKKAGIVSKFPMVGAVKIAQLGVDHSFRTTFSGTGTELLYFAYRNARQAMGIGVLGLSVDSETAPAPVGFYTARGFVKMRSTSAKQRDAAQNTISMWLDVRNPPEWIRVRVAADDAGDPEEQPQEPEPGA